MSCYIRLSKSEINIWTWNTKMTIGQNHRRNKFLINWRNCFTLQIMLMHFWQNSDDLSNVLSFPKYVPRVAVSISRNQLLQDKLLRAVSADSYLILFYFQANYSGLNCQNRWKYLFENLRAHISNQNSTDRGAWSKPFLWRAYSENEEEPCDPTPGCHRK